MKWAKECCEAGMLKNWKQFKDLIATRPDGEQVKSIRTVDPPPRARGDGRNTANMVSTKAARGKAPSGAAAVLLWQKDNVVINKGLRHADGLGTATVGGKELYNTEEEKNTERKASWIIETVKEREQETKTKKR